MDLSVLDAARRRLRHIFDLHDTVAVCFSGGKDSLATVHLAWEIAQERGHKKLNVIFRDTELMPSVVIDFVNEYRQLPWVNLLWLAPPTVGTKFVLGKVEEHVRWDPARRWLRPMPEWAVRGGGGFPEGYVFKGTEDMDRLMASFYKGRIAFLTGVRSDESLIRFRSCMAKMNESYINASGSPRAWICRPIYDWTENDVFKLFHERGIRYCGLYDQQNLAIEKLRVETPFIAENAKRLGMWREVDPTFYQQIVDLFPEMIVQERYWGDFDHEQQGADYADGFEGVERYIYENISGPQRILAMKRWRIIQTWRKREPEKFPARYVLRYFMTGAYKRKLMPKKVKEATCSPTIQ